MYAESVEHQQLFGNEKLVDDVNARLYLLLLHIVLFSRDEVLFAPISAVISIPISFPVIILFCMLKYEL